MPKLIETKDIENGFEYFTSISDLNEKYYRAKITLPYPKVKELKLTTKTKLKITVEILNNR